MDIWRSVQPVDSTARHRGVILAEYVGEVGHRRFARGSNAYSFLFCPRVAVPEYKTKLLGGLETLDLLNPPEETKEEETPAAE